MHFDRSNLSEFRRNKLNPKTTTKGGFIAVYTYGNFLPVGTFYCFTTLNKKNPSIEWVHLIIDDAACNLVISGVVVFYVPCDTLTFQNISGSGLLQSNNYLTLKNGKLMYASLSASELGLFLQ